MGKGSSRGVSDSRSSRDHLTGYDGVTADSEINSSGGLDKMSYLIREMCRGVEV